MTTNPQTTSPLYERLSASQGQSRQIPEALGASWETCTYCGNTQYDCTCMESCMTCGYPLYECMCTDTPTIMDTPWETCLYCGYPIDECICTDTPTPEETCMNCHAKPPCGECGCGRKTCECGNCPICGRPNCIKCPPCENMKCERAACKCPPCGRLLFGNARCGWHSCIKHGHAVCTPSGCIVLDGWWCNKCGKFAPCPCTEALGAFFFEELEGDLLTFLGGSGQSWPPVDVGTSEPDKTPPNILGNEIVGGPWDAIQDFFTTSSDKIPSTPPSDCTEVPDDINDDESEKGNSKEESTDNDSVSLTVPFGRLPQWPGLPDGRLRLYASELNPALADGSLLFYDHIAERRIAARVPSGRADGNSIAIATQRGHLRYYAFDGQSSKGTPFGGSQNFRENLRMLNADGTPFAGNVQNAAFFEETLSSGTVMRYSATDGNIVAITPESSSSIPADTFMKQLICLHVDAEGQAVTYRTIRDTLAGANDIYRDRIRQIWNSTDGLLDMPATNRIDWYGPADVTGQLNTAGFFTLKPGAEPLRSWIIESDEESQELTSLQIRELQSTLATSTRWTRLADGSLLYTKGTGQEALSTLKVRERLDTPQNAIVRPNGHAVTIDGVATGHYAETKYTLQPGSSPNAASQLSASDTLEATRHVYRSYPFGEVKESTTRAYGTPKAKTWTYTYGTDPSRPDYGRRTTTTRPDSTQSTFEYDERGNRTLVRTPWGEHEYRETRTSYINERFNDRRVAGRREVHVHADGRRTVLSETDYRYEEEENLRRETVTRRYLGSPHPETSFTEWYTDHVCPWAIERIKRTHSHDGRETLYDYTDITTQAGAVLHCTGSIEGVNGEYITGESTRTFTLTDANGDTVAVIDQVHDSLEFTTVSTRYMTYDERHRVIRTQYGSGKEELTEWSCCGPLWEKDAEGIETRYSYNSARQLVKVERDAAPVLENYNAPHSSPAQPMSITQYEYDAAGRRTTVITTMGAKVTRTQTAYDELGRTVSTKDELGRTTTYAYSTDGLTTTVIGPSGATSITVTNTDGSLISQTGTVQRATWYSRQVTNCGLLTIVRHDAAEGPEASRSLSSASGRTLASWTPAADGSGDMIQTQYTYDNLGRLVLEQTEGSAPVATDYDSFGNAVRRTVQCPEGCRISETESRYATLPEDAPALPACIPADAIWRETTSIAWQPDGTKVSNLSYTPVDQWKGAIETASLARDKYGSWSLQYIENRQGNRKSISVVPGVTGNAEAISVDGRMVRSKDAAGITTHYLRACTTTGETLTAIDGRGKSAVVAYDLAGRAVSATDEAGNTTTTAYDPVTGQPSCITDAQGNTICYIYDIRGNRIAQYGSAVQPIKWSYDDAGRMIAMRTWREPATILTALPSSGGDETTWEYDGVTGLLLAKHFADGTTTSYRYDRFGKLIEETNGNGESITYTHKPLTGELSTKRIGSGQNDIQTFTYDGLGRLIEVTDKAGTTTITYDRYGDKAGETVVNGSVASALAYEKDSIGRNAGYSLRIDGKNVQTLDLSYDTVGRLGTATLDGDKPFLYGYHGQLGFNNIITYPNGIEKTITLADERNLPAQILYRNTKSSADVFSEEMEHDSLARLTGKTDTINAMPVTTNYRYNERGELIEATHGMPDKLNQWEYDNIGNRVSMQDDQYASYGTNSVNQYTGDRTHDQAGNTTKLSTYGYGNEWNVAYNAESRPVRFMRTWDDGNGETLQEVTMDYDHMGRRRDKKLYIGGELLEWKRYVYDGYTQVAELRAVDEINPVFVILSTTLWDPSQPSSTRPLVWSSWLNGSKEEEILPRYEGYDPYWATSESVWYESTPPFEENIPASGSVYLLHDHNKNVRCITDANGTLQGGYDYAPYGQYTQVTFGIARVNPWRFSSEYYDRELDLVYYNFRHYNPNDGRWISRDHIAEQGGWNLYNFVGNRPADRWDVLGQEEGRKYKKTKFRLTTRQIAKCLNIKVTSNDIIWEPKSVIPAGIDRLRGYRNLVEAQWKNTEYCKCVHKIYVEERYDWVKLVQAQVLPEGKNNIPPDDHGPNEHEEAYTGGRGGLIIQTLIPPSYAPKKDQYNYNDHFFLLVAVPTKQAEKEYVGVRIKVYVDKPFESGVQNSTEYLLDDYFWF